MQCTCLYMHNTSPSTEDSYISTAANYGFVLSLNVCKNTHCNRINCHHQLLLNLAVELHTRSNHLEQGTPEVEAHAPLPPQAKATYLRNTPFHRLYLKVIAITFPTPHKTSLFSLTYFPRIQLTIKNINNKDSIIFTIYFILLCLRTLHSFQERRRTNQSLNLIISGPDSNIKHSKINIRQEKELEVCKAQG